LCNICHLHPNTIDELTVIDFFNLLDSCDAYMEAMSRKA
jgi:hypothetical protein